MRLVRDASLLNLWNTTAYFVHLNPTNFNLQISPRTAFETLQIWIQRATISKKFLRQGFLPLREANVVKRKRGGLLSLRLVEDKKRDGNKHEVSFYSRQIHFKSEEKFYSDCWEVQAISSSRFLAK